MGEVVVSAAVGEGVAGACVDVRRHLPPAHVQSLAFLHDLGLDRAPSNFSHVLHATVVGWAVVGPGEGALVMSAVNKHAFPAHVHSLALLQCFDPFLASVNFPHADHATVVGWAVVGPGLGDVVMLAVTRHSLPVHVQNALFLLHCLLLPYRPQRLQLVVGASVGNIVGAALGASVVGVFVVGERVGDFVVGDGVGNPVGNPVGERVGNLVGANVGDRVVGDFVVGERVGGPVVGDSVADGDLVGGRRASMSTAHCVSDSS